MAVDTVKRNKRNSKWDKENSRQVKLVLYLKSDAEILEWLDAQENRTESIRKAIRAQIELEKKQNEEKSSL